jgi:YidC/Oxa1 family membrane protein insertase
MDKNQVTGLVLISGLLLIYFYFFAPKPAEEQPAGNPVEMTTPDQDAITQPEPQVQAQTIEAESDEEMKLDSADVKPQGPYTEILKGEDKDVSIENDVAIFTFSTLGGSISSVELKEFKTAAQKPLILLDKKSSVISEIIETQSGPLDINQIYYTPEISSSSVSGKDSLEIKFVAKDDLNRYVVKSYKIPGNTYTITQSISLDGLKDQLRNDRIAYTWVNNLKKFEKDLKTSQMKTTINYYTALGDFDDLSESSSDPEEATLNEPVSWISFKQKFFTSGIIGGKPLLGAAVMTDPNNLDTTTVKAGMIKTNIPLEGHATINKYYYGPNNYQVLKKVAPGFSKNIYLGWPPVNLVNKFLIIPTFNFLDRYITNYGIIIILTRWGYAEGPGRSDGIIQAGRCQSHQRMYPPSVTDANPVFHVLFLPQFNRTETGGIFMG